MAGAVSILLLVTLQFVISNCSKRTVRSVYRPYGPNMCEELCKDSTDTFLFAKEDLTCHRVPDEGKTHPKMGDSVSLAPALKRNVCHADSHAETCPDDWIRHGDSCYLLIGKKQPWAAANQTCWNHGASLAAIQTEEESMFVRGYVKKSSGSARSTWIGGTDMDIEGQWKWMPSGDGFTFTDWIGSEPNKDGDCLLIQDGRSYDLHWVDASCTSPHSVMCEKPCV